MALKEIKKEYDVILVGAGPAGIFASYELMLKGSNLNVLLTSFTPVSIVILEEPKSSTDTTSFNI